MPRLNYETTALHTFQWHTVLESGQRKQLFSESTPHPVRSIECEIGPSGMSPKNGSMDILMLGISHDTCRAIIDIGTACWTFSGPWFSRGAVVGKLIVPVRQSHSLYVENFGAEVARVTVHELVRFRMPVAY